MEMLLIVIVSTLFIFYFRSLYQLHKATKKMKMLLEKIEEQKNK